jgi:hypothetical protein
MMDDIERFRRIKAIRLLARIDPISSLPERMAEIAKLASGSDLQREAAPSPDRKERGGKTRSSE